MISGASADALRMKVEGTGAPLEPYYQLVDPPAVPTATRRASPTSGRMLDGQVPTGPTYHAQVIAYASQMKAQQGQADDAHSDSSGGADSASGQRSAEGAPMQRRAAADYDDYFRHDRYSRNGSSEYKSSRAGCCCGVAVGNNVQFWRLSPQARLFPRVCMWGPDWPCMFVTYALLIGPSIAFLLFVAPNLHPAVVAFGVILCLLAVAMFTVTNARYRAGGAGREGPCGPYPLLPLLQRPWHRAQANGGAAGGSAGCAGRGGAP